MGAEEVDGFEQHRQDNPNRGQDRQRCREDQQRPDAFFHGIARPEIHRDYSHSREHAHESDKDHHDRAQGMTHSCKSLISSGRFDRTRIKCAPQCDART